MRLYLKAWLFKLLAAFCLATSSINISLAQYPDRFVHYRSIPTNCVFWQSARKSYASEHLATAIAQSDVAMDKYRNEEQWEHYLFISSFKAQLQGENSRPQEALETLQQARDRVSGRVDPLQSIELIENYLLTARVYTLVNDYQMSESFFTEATKLLEESGTYPEVLAMTYFTLWQLHSKMMNSDKANTYISRATSILQNQSSDYAKAILYFIQAERLDKTQLYLKVELFEAAAKAFEKSGARQDFTYYTTLMKLSQQYYAFQRDYDKATRYGKLAEEYAMANSMSQAKVYGLNFALGDLYRNFNEYDKALPYFINAKQITSEVFGTTSLEYITANLYLGRLYRNMKIYDKASQCFNEVYSAGKSGWEGRFPHEFTLYGELARLYLQWNKPDSALGIAQKRLGYEHRGKEFDLHDIPPTPRDSYIIRYYRSLAAKIEAYKRLYQQAQDTSLLTHGLNHCSYALKLIDIINDKALGEQSGIENSRRAKAIASYGIYFSLEKNKHKQDDETVRQAVMYSEKANANYLKYLLSSRYSHSEVEDSAEVALRNQIEEIDLKLQEIGDNVSTEYNNLHNQSLSLKLQLANTVLNAKPKINTTPQRLNPIIPELNLDSLQGQISNDMAIIFYHIDSYNDDSEDIVTGIDKQSRRLIRFYIDSNTIEHTTTQLSAQQVDAFAAYFRSLKTGDLDGYRLYGTTLYKLLFADIEQPLSAKKRIVVIPDPLFSDIPLESLPIDNTGNTICSKLATSYHYSLSLWARSHSKATDANRLNFAAFAPDFSALNSSPAIADNISISPQSNANDRDNIKQMALLPMAKQEVLMLGKLFGTKAEGQMLVNFDKVSKSEFAMQIADFDIIHIASHGFADIHNFRNSGIYFSSEKSIDALHLNEIYNLNTQANLVVLSACQTSVGQKVQGEGVMALPRGFMYAGVPNVIASLWKVHDEKTKQLMVAFYQHLLSGMSYAEALQLAKLECISNGFLPTDWASFILIGR